MAVADTAGRCPATPRDLFRITEVFELHSLPGSPATATAPHPR